MGSVVKVVSFTLLLPAKNKGCVVLISVPHRCRAVLQGPLAAGVNFTLFDYLVSGLRGQLTGLPALHHVREGDANLGRANANMNLVMEYHRTFSDQSHAAWGK